MVSEIDLARSKGKGGCCTRVLWHRERGGAGLSFTNHNDIAIAGAGGIGLVVVTMTAHATHAKVQEQGCGALGNLAMHDDNVIMIAGAVGVGGGGDGCTRGKRRRAGKGLSNSGKSRPQ